jgi:hypothetical protein
VKSEKFVQCPKAGAEGLRDILKWSICKISFSGPCTIKKLPIYNGTQNSITVFSSSDETSPKLHILFH